MAKLNKDRVRKLANTLSRGALPTHKDVGFNMASFNPEGGRKDYTGRHCKTTCCLAGWTVLLFENENRRTSWPVSYRAMRLLGLDHTQRADLFYQETGTKRRAISVLRHLVKTGKVEWHRFKSDGTARKATP